MREYLIYIVQSGICLSFFWAIYVFCLRKQTCLKFNRGFLLIGLVVSFILPSIQFSYDVIIPMPASLNISDNQSIAESSNHQKPSISLWDISLLMYLLGVSILIAKNIYTFLRLHKLKKTGVATNRDGYTIVDHPKAVTPFSILSYIFINTVKLQTKEIDIILKHEISHIKQKHWIDLLCGECALLLQWFNPLMWLYIHSLKGNHEYLADQAVLNDGESKTIYRAVLINQRFQGPVFSFTNSFSYSNHQNRLIMMKKTKTSPWKKVAALAVFPLIGIFFTLSAKPNYIVEEKAIDNASNSFAIESMEDKAHFSVDNLMNEESTDANIQPKETKVRTSFDEDSLLVIGQKLSQKVVELLKEDSLPTLPISENDSIIVSTIKAGENGIDHLFIDMEKRVMKEQALIFLDGKKISKKEMDNIDDNIIESVEILKDELARKKYGEEGKDGAIIITTKGKGNNKEPKNFSKDLGTKNGSPFVLLDGTEISIKKMDKLDSNIVDNLEIIKGQKAIEKYGKKGKNGVIIITTKREETPMKDGDKSTSN